MGNDAAPNFLSATRHLIASSWTQHADARTNDGSSVDPWSPNAVSWSLLGALVAVYERLLRSDGQAAALEALAGACNRLADTIDSSSLSAWNDAAGRTQTDILAALEEAGTGPAGPPPSSP